MRGCIHSCNLFVVSQDGKKVGRPIAYKGDPNASNLTETERRRIKRRIANRESARRVRARRQETLEELQHRVGYMTHLSLIPHQIPCVRFEAALVHTNVYP